MHVGIYFDLRNPPAWRRPWADQYAASLELIEDAERRGIDAVWLTEHHFFEDGYLPQPLTFAAAIAARTRTVRIGTAVLLAPLRSAVQLAEEAAVVDIVSGGRLELGLGAGYRVPEFEAFGADIGRRYSTTDARVRELRELWAEGRVTPPAVQDPIPLWLGYQGPQGARRAGRLGVGLLSINRDLLEPYREGLQEGGHDPASARMAGQLNIVIADDPEPAWARIQDHVAYQHNSYRRYLVEGTGRPDPHPVDPARIRERGSGVLARFDVVTPDGAVALITRHVEGLPVEHLYLWATIAGMPDDIAARHVELLTDVVRPQVTHLGLS
ncbi:MAG: LLM class flavin-dependent oxidoreductase [Actinobacteria bacterium]|nr:MAG: LLM class flavin-dependent oxidoreductase [Actinomycetota bacterium]